MGCTAGCLNIFLEDEEHIEIFAQTFAEVMEPHLYEPMEADEVAELFDTTQGDVMFTLDSEPIFAVGHGTGYVLDFLLEFLKKAPDASLEGDYYSDYDNCCDIACLQFEYKEGKLSLMRLFSDQFGMECEECGAEVEMSDVEVHFDKARRLECPECGAQFPQQDDEDFCFVSVDDIVLEDGEWVFPEGFEADGEIDEYLTGMAPDEVTNAWKYEDELAEKGILPDLPKGPPAWGDLPRTHAMAEQGDEKAIEILAALEAFDASMGADSEEPEEIAEEPEEPAEESAQSAEGFAQSAPKKKRRWWIIPLILALLAAGAAAVQFLGLYDIVGLLA